MEKAALASASLKQLPPGIIQTTVGDAEALDGLLGSTPVDLNTTGRSLAAAACTQYRTQYEPGLVPLAVIELGASTTVSTGLAYVQINWTPHPSRTATAA